MNHPQKLPCFLKPETLLFLKGPPRFFDISSLTKMQDQLERRAENTTNTPGNVMKKYQKNG